MNENIIVELVKSSPAIALASGMIYAMYRIIVNDMSQNNAQLDRLVEKIDDLIGSNNRLSNRIEQFILTVQQNNDTIKNDKVEK